VRTRARSAIHTNPRTTFGAEALELLVLLALLELLVLLALVLVLALVR
jgi:hypothetical protein